MIFFKFKLFISEKIDVYFVIQKGKPIHMTSLRSRSITLNETDLCFKDPFMGVSPKINQWKY